MRHPFGGDPRRGRRRGPGPGRRPPPGRRRRRGLPVLRLGALLGYRTRDEELASNHHVICVEVAGRQYAIYVDKILGFGLRRYFREIYSADELPATWKDPRKLKADYVIDVVQEHQT